MAMSEPELSRSGRERRRARASPFGRAGRDQALVALLISTAVPLGLVLWAGASHRVLAPGDGLAYYLPMHKLAAEALRAGHLPAWNPFQFAGSPLLATAQPAPFYPPEAAFL